MFEEPGAVIPHAGICCGVRRVTGASTVTANSVRTEETATEEK